MKNNGSFRDKYFETKKYQLNTTKSPAEIREKRRSSEIKKKIDAYLNKKVSNKF